jgi:heme A synthase
VARVDVGLLSSPLIVLAIMLYGAAGFYLGIDLPPAPPDHRLPLPLTRNLGSRADAVELLSAAGTFVAAVAAVASVSGIVLDEAARTSTARAIIIGWAIGSTMQIAAGIMARTRAEPSTTS